MESEARALVAELSDALEKLALWSAREAKRRSRDARQGVEQLTTDAPPPHPDATEPAASAFPDRVEFKRELWRRVGGIRR